MSGSANVVHQATRLLHLNAFCLSALI